MFSSIFNSGSAGRLWNSVRPLKFSCFSEAFPGLDLLTARCDKVQQEKHLMFVYDLPILLLMFVYDSLSNSASVNRKCVRVKPFEAKDLGHDLCYLRN